MKTADKISIWKWIPELVLGAVIFIVLYGISQWVLDLAPVASKFIVIPVAAIVLLMLFIAWTRLFEGKWRFDLVAKKTSGYLSAGMLIGFVYFMLTAGILYIFGCYSPLYASPDWFAISLNLFFFFFVACGEEVIFRGILFRMIDERFGMWWALCISALLFGFVHIFQPGSSIWSSLAIAVEAGVLLGVAFKYSGSLWLPIGIHWIWNFAQGNVFGFSVSGNNGMESILNSVISGPDLLTGGDFGPEASVIAVALGIILSVVFLRKHFNKPLAD